MTCTERWSSCNGYFLLALSFLAIGLNLTPLVADYVEDGKPFFNSISCYEWWLPGLVGGGLLVLPAVAMTLAARKKGSCNSRMGMLLSSLLCLVSIIGGLYCTIIAIFAISNGPLICEKGSQTLESCDYTLGKLSEFENLKFDLAWFLNETCIPASSNSNGTHRLLEERISDLPDFDMYIDEDTQKLIHIIVFVSLAVVGLLEVATSVSQVVAGLFGFLCGTTKRRKHKEQDHDDNRGQLNLGYMNQPSNQSWGQPQWHNQGNVPR
ncbi:transmembrane 4 L6 family member 20 [Hyperolius riggenbachi]|uniref:transmembrane 4 L6 family member 20 n=1 Tax=Hyperolius riggenbachi TaxID=752182 RepID=UPI0035A2E641